MHTLQAQRVKDTQLPPGRGRDSTWYHVFRRPPALQCARGRLCGRYCAFPSILLRCHVGPVDAQVVRLPAAAGCHGCEHPSSARSVCVIVWRAIHPTRLSWLGVACDQRRTLNCDAFVLWLFSSHSLQRACGALSAFAGVYSWADLPYVQSGSPKQCLVRAPP